MSESRFRVTFFVALAICAVPARSVARPRLAVLIAVDQLCAEQLTRYEPLFTGGFATLLHQGVVYSEAHHDHAMTVTATGHATLSTGCHPSRHGIVGNNWYERTSGQKLYCCRDSTVQTIGDPDAEGRSPQYLMSSTLGDWMKEQSAESKVLSVSQKDRSAIFLGGLGPDGVYWFDDARGNFVTSTYYHDTMPAWVISFDCFSYRERAVRDGWRKRWSDDKYRLANLDDSPGEDDWNHDTFPHTYDSSIASRMTPSEWLLETPFSDEMVLDFAQTMVVAESLGADSIPDLLCISLAAIDYIGHSYGPFSQEILDGLFRLDSSLAGFLMTLDRLVGNGQYTLVLTSDHGVMPLPEDKSALGGRAERILRSDVKTDLDRAARRAADNLEITQPLIAGYVNGMLINKAAGEEHGVAAPDLRQAVAKAIRKIDYVEDVMTYEELTEPREAGHGYRAMYRQSFHPDRAPDLVIRYSENVLISDTPHGTTHGTPYRYDTHIPLIFWGAYSNRRSRTVKDRVRTVDVAPTLAVILGITPPKGIDGAVLRKALVSPGD